MKNLHKKTLMELTPGKFIWQCRSLALGIMSSIMLRPFIKLEKVRLQRKQVLPYCPQKKIIKNSLAAIVSKQYCSSYEQP